MIIHAKAPPGRYRFVRYHLRRKKEKLLGIYPSIEAAAPESDRRNRFRTSKFIVYLVVDERGLAVRGAGDAWSAHVPSEERLRLKLLRLMGIIRWGGEALRNRRQSMASA